MDKAQNYIKFIEENTLGYFNGFSLIGGEFKLIVYTKFHFISFSIECNLSLEGFEGTDYHNAKIKDSYDELIAFGFFLSDNCFEIKNVDFNNYDIILNLENNSAILFEVSSNEWPEVLGIEYTPRELEPTEIPNAYFSINSNRTFYDGFTKITYK